MGDAALQEFLKRHPMSSYDPDKQYPKTDWLIEGLFLGGGKINGLFGVPKSGKSRLLGWSLVSMLSGEPFMPELPLGGVSPERVLYVHAEEDEGAIVNRIRSYAKVLKVDDSGWGERLQFMPGMGMGLQRDVNKVVMNRVLRGSRPDLIVIDPYVRIHEAKESDNTEMARLHNEFRRWVQDYGMDIILLHHTGKLDPEIEIENDVSRWARGSSDIAAMLDAAVYVWRTKSNEIKLYRTGRYSPLPELIITDQGDERPWRKFIPKRRK